MPAPLRPTRPTFRPSEGRGSAIEQAALPRRKKSSLICSIGRRRLPRGNGTSPTRLPRAEPRVYKPRPLAEVHAKRGLMAVERIFSIIKPDATRRNLTGRSTPASRSGPAHRGPEAHLDKPAAGRDVLRRPQGAAVLRRAVQFHDVGPVVVQVLEGDTPRQEPRGHGRHQPANAAAGTIRKDFAESIEANSVHGSDGRTTPRSRSPSSYRRPDRRLSADVARHIIGARHSSGASSLIERSHERNWSCALP